MKLQFRHLLGFAVAMMLVQSCKKSDTPIGVEQGSELCPRHGVQLVMQNGFEPDPGAMIDPSGDYLRFMDEGRYPRTLPWYFSTVKSEMNCSPTSAFYCKDCQREFAADFAAFQRLSFDAKEAYWDDNLRRQLKRETEQAGAGQPATRSQSDSEGGDKPQTESEGRSR